MTECRNFFDGLETECNQTGDGSIRGDRLRAMGADKLQRLIDWEQQSASGYSPGPVAARETIRKALFQGQDVDEGALHRNAFGSLRDLGLSADRSAYSTEAEINARFAALAVRKGKPLYGHVDLNVDHLRSHSAPSGNEGESVRTIGVYDTGLVDNPGHAEAFIIWIKSNTKPYKSIQTDLLDAYSSQVFRYG
jgi:hypothetical protein